LVPVLMFSLAIVAVNRSKTNLKTELFTSLGMLVSLIGAVLVYQFGTINSGLLGWAGLGLSLRLDALSATMLSMISILAFVILKFSKNYMDGDSRKNVFLGRLSVTIASVQMLVLSGNLFQILIFWVITSICLHYLLVFYRHRPQAIAAARKKFMVARMGDLSLAVAFALLYASFGTGELNDIFTDVASGVVFSSSMTWATILMVVAALLKSAQFPTHGWLIEVVETPTPVSSLLHAGLLNAGPFLMVRFSYLMNESTSASMLLIIVGGLTALFASVVYLTQPSIKVSLGYSSVAHMGFSLLLCGLGVYSAAILHVVGHSFYKAHAFLSSGSVIESIKSNKAKYAKRIGNPLLIALSIIAALSIFMVGAYFWGVHLSEDFSLMVIALVIVMGMSLFLVQTLDAKSGIQTILQTALIAGIVAGSFLTFEHGARWLLQSEIPALDAPSMSEKITAIILLVCFGIVVLAQLFAPRFKQSKFSYQLGVHLRNGLYANVLFDRMIGSLKHEKFKWANLTVQEESDQSKPTESELLIKEASQLINQ